MSKICHIAICHTENLVKTVLRIIAVINKETRRITMNDSFVTALNCQKATLSWIDVLTDNVTNVYTPGFKANQVKFSTFVGGAIVDNPDRSQSQGKSTPGPANSNLFLEGKGYFLTRNAEGKSFYTRLGDFTFDKDGVYVSKNGNTVQGYILNDKGEIMQGTKALNADEYQQTGLRGGAMNVPTTNIKLWIDPNNGKFLGKYDDYEIKHDRTIYGKMSNGKVTVPLYKVAVMNFQNPQGLYMVSDNQYVQTEESGKPVVGVAQVRSGLLELSNVDFKGNISYYQQAKAQMEMVNKLISSNKDLLQKAMELLGS